MIATKPGLIKDKAYASPLTSIRGVACMVVLCGHVIQVFRYHPVSSDGPLRWLRTIICSAFNAEAAVVVFFVLSGCVLSISLRRITGLSSRIVGGFYIKRVFRIYPLLWMSLVLATLSMLVARDLASEPVFADWLARNLHTRINLVHSVLSATGAYTRYNGPMWSLRVELIYSALFPFIFVLVRKGATRWVLIGGLAAIALMPAPTELGLSFGLSFAIGALIPLIEVSRPMRHWCWPIFATAFLLWDRLVLGGLHLPERVFDLLESGAAFIVVQNVHVFGERYRLLVAPLLVWVGELSYSIYLLHLPILLILFAAAARMFGVGAVLGHPAVAQIGLGIATMVLTLILAAGTYNFVELPLHRFGRSLGAKVMGSGLRAALMPLASPIRKVKA